MIPIESRDTVYTCRFCSQTVFWRGSFLVTAEVPPGMIFSSDCPARPLPGYASARWGPHAVVASNDDQQHEAEQNASTL